jgi:hypothetical protein
MVARFPPLPQGCYFSFDIRWPVLAILLIGTFGFFKFFDRYAAVGPELLVDPGFQAGFTHWDLTGLGSAAITAPGEITLHAGERERGAGVAVRQWLASPRHYGLLRLSGELKAHDIQAGERFWHKGRLVLASFDAAERMLRVPHVVVDLEGTRSWQTYEAVFHIPATARRLQIGVQLIGATGSVTVRNLSLRAVEERGSYPLYRQLGITLWAVTLLGLALSYRSQWRWNPPYLLMYAATAGIFVGTLMPVEWKLVLETHIEAALIRCMPWLGSFTDTDRHGDPTLFSKLGHVLLFGLLAVALRWAYPQQRLVEGVMVLLLLALISEVLQFFVEGRLPQVNDWLLDGIGLLTGVALFEAASMIHHAVHPGRADRR